VQRYVSIIPLKPDAEEKYKRRHRDVWPEVLSRISTCHIVNYSIFLRDGALFSYFEYAGTDLAADLRRMAADQKTQAWWAITNPMQTPLANRAEGEWWASMEEVFHLDCEWNALWG
jgi:L-rhamnose mutarotase